MNEFDLQFVLDTTANLVTTWGLKVVGALVVLIAGRVAAGWLRSGVRKALLG